MMHNLHVFSKKKSGSKLQIIGYQKLMYHQWPLGGYEEPFHIINWGFSIPLGVRAILLYI